jgi:DNA-damage-inducible protein D
MQTPTPKTRKRKMKEMVQEGEQEICRFTGKNIRKVCHNDEWHFSVVDVIAALTDTPSPSRYWFDLRVKLKTQGAYELFDKIVKLKMVSGDDKYHPTDAANTETLFRIIQAIPSPKAEPFKQWLAKTGYERIQEHQNPSIAIKRAIVDYQLKGRPMDWIEARLRTLFSRKELTDEWRDRGVKEAVEFAVLTDDIHLGAFGKTTGQHKEHKSLKKKQSLRDNMTNTELVLTMLGEVATKQIAGSRDAIGFVANQEAARSGGQIAGNARLALERATGTKVLSSKNNLESLPPSKDLLKFPSTLEDGLKRAYKHPPNEEEPV